MSAESHLRELLGRLLAWEDAHVGFDTAVADIPMSARGAVPAGFPHSLWQLLDHLRRTQHDILDFCRNPQYQELQWPADYWPPSAAPPSDAAWEESVRVYRHDRSALQRLAADTRNRDRRCHPARDPARHTRASWCWPLTTLPTTSDR